MVFADSYYFFALLSPADFGHDRARLWASSFDGTLVTTAWVLVEVADGFARQPHLRKLFVDFLAAIRSSGAVDIVIPDDKLWELGIDLYACRPDKQWSLTDCISFVVMQQKGLTQALTGDHHFEQAGFVALLR